MSDLTSRQTAGTNSGKLNNNQWTPRPVRLGLVQYAMGDDPEDNLSQATRLIEQAVSEGAQIVCLPELFRTPYFCIKESCDTDCTENNLSGLIDALSDLSRRLKIVLVAGSVYEQTSDNRKFNTSLVFDTDGSLLGSYRKTHIPHDPCFYEANYFEPGDTGFRVFETKFGRIAVLICYDQWFPEAARCCALLGAEIIFYPTAIAVVDDLPQSEGNWQNYWERTQCGHAAANNLIVAAVNRVGREGKSSFWGGSFVANALGEVLARAGSVEQVLVVDVDIEHSRYSRTSWRFFESRRPECYGGIVK